MRRDKPNRSRIAEITLSLLAGSARCRRRRIAQRALLGAALAVGSGCTVENYPLDRVPDFPAQSTAQSPFRERPEYRIQAGDNLIVQSYYDKSLRQVITVRPDGRISLILLGETEAAGKTAASLDEELRQAYWQRLPAHPDIVVSVNQIASEVVYVGGEVKGPTIEPIKGSLTLLQSIMTAGGFLPSANLAQVIVLREQDDGQFRAFQHNANRTLDNRASELYLEPHDIVYVPKTRVAQVDQYVSQYINQIVPEAIRFNFGYEFFDQQGNTSVQVPPR